jgi:hypothetical protein
MPFKDPFNEYYTEIFKSAIEKAGLNPIRADEVFGTRAIIKDIFHLIQESSVLVAELKERNPNVAYELGVAHALGKPVVMVINDASQIPFDLKHLRIITYNTSRPKWDVRLAEEIEKTIQHVLAKPNEQLAIDIDIELLGNQKIPLPIKNLLISSFKDFEGHLSKEVYIDIDEFGNANMKHRATQFAKSNITHLTFEIYLDTPGKIKLISATNTDEKKELKYFTLDETDTSHTFAVLFDNPVQKGSNTNYEYEIYAENYLELLVRDDLGGINIAPYYKLKYTRVKEVYSFPDITIFRNLKARFLNHPLKKMINIHIHPIKKNNKLIFDLDYGNLSKYNSDIIIEFTK